MPTVTPGARTAVAAATAVALLAAALAGCDSGGVRIEASGTAAPEAGGSPGPLSASPLPASPPSPSPGPGEDRVRAAATGPAPRTPVPSALPTEARPVYPPDAEGELDVLDLLREDPKVGGSVKKALRPCSAEVWPVEVSYGRLTGGHAFDVLVNVSDCTEGMGVGAYVYRQSTNGQYVGVFAAEEPPVRAEADRDRLRVTQQVYADGDPVCCPSGQDVVTYEWRGDRFTAVGRELREPGPAEGTDRPAPEPTREGTD